MPTASGKSLLKKLERFNSSWDNHMKHPVIDITLPISYCDNTDITLTSSFCDSIDDDDQSSSDDSSSTNSGCYTEKKNKSLQRFLESELSFDRLLGSGAFSDVYQARHKITGRVFAVKKLRDAVKNNPRFLPACAADLALEAAVLANLSHKNIVTLHGIRGDDNVLDLLKNGTFFICLDPLYDTLQDKLVQWRHQTSKKDYRNQRLFRSSSRIMKNNTEIIKRLEEIVMGIVNGMEYLHTNNIIYRDLKPGNIGFDKKTKQVKIFDFGLARIVLPVQDNMTNNKNKTGQSRLMTRKIGTPRYMAPEIIRDESDYGFGVDVYSFSILLWQIVTDRVAFHSFSTAQELKQSVSMHNLRPPLRYVPKLRLIPEQKPTASLSVHKSSLLPIANNNYNRSLDSALLKEIIESGWSDLAESRPTFTTIRKQLQFIIKTSLVKSDGNNNTLPKPLLQRRRSINGFFKKSSSKNVTSSSGTTLKRRQSDPFY